MFETIENTALVRTLLENLVREFDEGDDPSLFGAIEDLRTLLNGHYVTEEV